jgi:hypothetical protein
MLHWSALLPVLIAFVFQWWRSRRSRPAWRVQGEYMNVAPLFILIFFCALAVFVGATMLTYTSGAFGIPAEKELSPSLWASTPLNLLFESPNKEAWRDTVYRLFSFVGFMAAFGVPWLFKARAVGTGVARLAFQATQLAGIIIAIAVLFLWPLCFGRLQLSYAKPEVRMHVKIAERSVDVSGLILNPQNDQWTIVSCSNNGKMICRYFSANLKDLEDYEIGPRQNVFKYGSVGTSD